jgi:2-desacetyl-2-hydroxyethyl bacteriochlorophyllide A dehydrogenase
MKQAFITSDGQIVLEEVSSPEASPGKVLVRSHYSAISTGTEVADIQYRRAHPGGDNIPLGYSLAGEILEVGDGVQDLQVGDLVVCGGWHISVHAEEIAVPQNYCSPLPKDTNLRHVSFSTIAAISLQAVRLASIGLGEVVVVFGTGIIGQFAAVLATLSGARTVVIGHSNEMRLEIAKGMGAELSILSSSTDPVEIVKDLTDGRGADAILHCGKTEETESVTQALEIAREKGKVVLVGSFPFDLPRTPLFRKELNLVVSRSTGPGRYDEEYEQRGVDYPQAYVRWTGRRNLAECARLIESGQIDVEKLITNDFPFSSAPEAFDLAVKRGPETLGVVFKYPAAS